MEQYSWHIIGGDPLADSLRQAQTYVQPALDTVVITDAETIPGGSISTGRAMLVANSGKIIPHLLAYQVVDEVRRATHAGEAGALYGCYGSYRLPRRTSSEHVANDALLPLLAVTLEIVQGDVTRVWARKASLLAEDDAWFVTLTVDAIIITLEALATADPPNTSELLIEATGSEQVLRAEPTRQAVTVAPFEAGSRVHGWWEDLGERLLQRANALDDAPMTGSASRLQTVWKAVQKSAGSGSTITPA
ncbi:MAG: hypothetical protein H0V47_10965 [Chloroflexia bacterium]|nr:hypothetical protein [Chloroflexia bacterium]